jgi:3-hydroxyisobutyrate dehydrogenase-like beta-hydroxyacid dehydrogenase
MSLKIGFVGVGRMGANMARRLQETGFTISAVFDVNGAAAQALAKELNCTAASDLKAVTALSEIVITVVSDDRAMKIVHQLRDGHARDSRLGGTKVRSERGELARGVHGVQHPAGARGLAVSHVRRQTGSV